MKRAIVLLVVINLIPSISVAEEDCTSLSTVMEVASNHDPVLLGADARIEAARADEQDARSVWRPQVSAFTRTGVGDTGLVDSQFDNQIGVRLSQRVYDFGQAQMRRESAESRRQSLVESRIGLVAESQLSAALEYLTILRETEKLTAIEQTEHLLLRQKEVVSRLLAEGLFTRADLTSIESRLAASKAAAAQLEFQVTRARSTLEIRISQPVHLCDRQAVDTVSRAVMESGPHPDDLVEKLLSQSPYIRSLRSEAHSFSADKDLASKNRLPVINLAGTASYASSGSDLSEWAYRDRLGVDVSVPILSGSSLNAQRRKAGAAHAEARGRLQLAERELREELIARYMLLASLEFQAQKLREARLSARRETEIVEAEITQGVSALPRLIDAQLNLETIWLDEIEAEYSLLEQRFRFAAMFGTLIGSE